MRRLLRAMRKPLAASLLALASAMEPAGAQTPESPAVPAATASAPVALPGSLPLRRDEAEPAGSVPWLASVVLLALLLAGGVLVVRRRGWGALLKAPMASRHGADLERVASQALTPQASVHAIRWRGEELLVGCTAQQLTLLARRPADGNSP